MTINDWLPYIFIGFTFALVVLSGVLSIVYYSSLRKDVNSIDNAIASISVATTNSLLTLNALIMDIDGTAKLKLQGRELRNKQTVLVTHQGFDNGVYEVDAEKRQLVKQADKQSTGLLMVTEGIHKGTIIATHTQIGDDLINSALARAKALNVDHTITHSTHIPSKSIQPLINGQIFNVICNYLTLNHVHLANVAISFALQVNAGVTDLAALSDTDTVQVQLPSLKTGTSFDAADLSHKDAAVYLVNGEVKTKLTPTLDAVSLKLTFTKPDNTSLLGSDLKTTGIAALYCDMIIGLKESTDK